MAGTSQTDSVRAEIAGFIKKSEETLSEAGRRFSEAVREFVPGDRSSIRSAVGEAFDYMERALRLQREFTNSVLDAVLREPAGKAAAPKAAIKAPSVTKRATVTKRPAATKRTAASKRPVGEKARPLS